MKLHRRSDQETLTLEGKSPHSSRERGLREARNPHTLIRFCSLPHGIVAR
jgi:hypothetical protein